MTLITTDANAVARQVHTRKPMTATVERAERLADAAAAAAAHERELERAEVTLARTREARRRAIQVAIAAGVPKTRLASATGLSHARIRQIAAGRD